MVLFNYATKELTAKVVYYGPGLCGKTSNLQYIYDTLPDQSKGKMLSLATKTDRTLFFDFLPIDLGNIRGMKTKIQLYTVPGQVFYDTTRKLVLKGADGVVFVADSQEPMLEANIDSFENLIINLKEQNQDLAELPYVLQYNKRDMKNAMSMANLDKHLNRHGVPTFEAVAVKGEGVFETLKGISKLVLKHLTRKYGLEVDANESKTAQAPPERKPPNLPPLTGRSGPPESKPAASPAAATASAAAPPNPTRASAVQKPLSRMEPPAPPAPSRPAATPFRELPSEHEGLAPLPHVDDSEVIDIDDMAPLEIEELDEMAEIAHMAQNPSGDGSGSGLAPSPTKVAFDEPEPIAVPVNITLPTSFAGNPIRLVIDIKFEDK